MDAGEIALSIRKEFALKTFRDGELTLVQAAAFCDMNIYDFILTASQTGIPIISYSVSDASPIIALTICGNLDLLDKLFDQVRIPPAVLMS
jgi:hypothetical protein